MRNTFDRARHDMSGTGRNDLCPCGSGKKYKRCCLGRDATGVHPGAALALARTVSGVDMTLALEASRSDDCLAWLAHCEAECCGGFNLWLAPDSDVVREHGQVRLRMSKIAPDVLRYYELHGGRYEVDTLVLPEENCTFHPELRLEVKMTCSALQSDHLCGLHTAGKPDVCRGLTRETASNGRYWLTPRCLFAYKLWESQAGQP